jgi:hypothetical protein
MFLLPSEVPPNLCGVKVGTRVRVVRARTVERVGYPLRVQDAPPLVQEEAIVRAALEGAFGTRRLGRMAQVHMRNAVRYAWLVSQKFGGDARGVLVLEGCAATEGEVLEKRTARVGTRQPGYQSYHDPSDCDGPQLVDTRSVVLFRMTWGWMMSGDTEVVRG